jgi:hypothetical protein
MKKKTEMAFKVPTTVTISRDRVSNLLCSAFEGGSNYWYQIDKFVAPPVLEFRSDETTVFRHLDYPLNEGGWLEISDKEGGDGGFILSLENIQKGLEAMAASDQYGHHWENFLAENDDAETGDVFLQFCLFGDCIYG